MSSAWIKMRVGLLKHPKVVRMSSALNADRKRIVGGLYEVWSLIDEHSADGVLPGYDLSAMDESIGWPGFSAAMHAVEWLAVVDPQTLAMPRFETHNGHSAKRRAMETERKTASRMAPNPVRELSASDADKSRTRVREEKDKKEQEPKAMSNASASDPPKIDKAERLAQVTRDAMAAYNAALTPSAEHPDRRLPKVTKVGFETRRQNVARVVKTAREICEEKFGTPTITPAFWQAYFELCEADDFHSGRTPGSGAHANWKPSFEFLTRPKTMLTIYERTSDEGEET